MLVVVCGLHGGAGTTTVAQILAAAAALHTPGSVLLCDAAPGDGDQALAHGLASASDLHALAHMVAEGRQPTVVPWADLTNGVRLLARAPEPRPPAPAAAVEEVLRDAAATHQLVVADAGTITSPYAPAALRAADVVIWALDSTATSRHCAALLSGNHSNPARHVAWLLAVNATGRDPQPTVGAELSALVPSAGSQVLIPVVRALDSADPSRQLAGSQLLAALI
jgi:MinD-like ATPase involved in chromosome partitioning or flagellar assembly